MKKAFLAFSMAAAVVMTHSTVLAKPATDKADKKDAENSLTTRIIEQVLTSIEFKAVQANFNINQMSVDGQQKDPKTGEKKAKVNIASANLEFLIPFKSDWVIDKVVTPKATAPRNANIDKLMPGVHASAASLELAARFKKTDHLATAEAGFFVRNDSTQTYDPRPLIVTLGNKMTKDISEIRFHGVSAEMRENPKNPDDRQFAGRCKAQKRGFDMSTRRIAMKDVTCEFNGVWTEQGYKIINLTFADK